MNLRFCDNQNENIQNRLEQSKYEQKMKNKKMSQESFQTINNQFWVKIKFIWLAKHTLQNEVVKKITLAQECDERW